MPECENCGTHHTDAYVRVFGDNDDVLHSCSDCEDTTLRELTEGDGANTDR